MLKASMAYKAAVLALMLGEASELSRRLELPIKLPISVESLKTIFVRIPGEGVSGRIATTNYTFSFFQGKLLSVAQADTNGLEMPRIQDYQTLANQKPIINGDQALGLATQWLAKISFDVTAFEKSSIRKVSQKAPGHHGPLPIYTVVWQSTNGLGSVTIEVDGLKKEMYSIRFSEEARIHFKRPQMVLTNETELQALPDPPLKSLEPGKPK